MNNYIDEGQLNEVLKNFHIITGLKLTIFGTNHNVLAEYPKTHCPFCKYINSTKDGNTLCEKSNWIAFDICNKTNKLHIYKCHAGLVEVAVPLIKYGKIIGYSIFGQIKNTKNTDDIIRKIEKLNDFIDVNQAVSLLSSVKYHSDELIKSEAKILEICSSFFISNEIISTRNDLIIYKAKNYIFNNIGTDFTVEELSNYLDISRTQLYNIFKKELNKGVKEYIRDERLKLSLELLKEDKYSVKEIALNTGFFDSTYFIKCFKEKMNCTPKQYKKMIESE